MYNPYQTLISQLEQQIAEHRKVLEDPALAELRELAESEIEHLNTQLKQLTEAAAQLEANSDSSAEQHTDGIHHNALIEFRQGTGGEEAKNWAADLQRMYLRFCDFEGLKYEFLDEDVLKIRGNTALGTAYQTLQYESGVHRVQRVPATEAQGRIHTSTATVAVLPEIHPAVITIREDELDWQFVRASGAGGQNVNKTSSAVRLTHVPTGIMTRASQHKHQEQNRKVALDLLRAQLWEIEEEKRLTALGSARSAIGRAQRAEKIRTYNFPQSRVTDHRVKLSWHNLDAILDGNLMPMLTDLHQAFTEPTAPETPASNDTEEE